jgi:hypothetical protein
MATNLPPLEGIAINYKFKMYMEGIPCPFESATISCTPNGVEMNIEVHPTDKVYDLKPKTHIAIFYLDFHITGGSAKWRLMGEGYFSGFAKYDNAAGSRTVSLVCRDFRMDIRKTPAAFVFQPDDSQFDKLYLMNRYGIKRAFQIITKDMKKKTVGITSRTYGGMLRPFGAIIGILSKTAAGADPDFSALGDNGRFLLDAISRSIWIEAVSASTYGTFINTRIRADKRMVIPENKAGYRFFSQEYLTAFGQQVIFNNSMFSSVESVIMRMGAIFQTSPVSCSTPNIVDVKNAMCEQMASHVMDNAEVKFGEPYVLNSCMLLPPMHFTAPPNCNILFPCMYDTVSWQHDYDTDLTRAYFRISEMFGGSSELSFRTKEVPNSLLAYNKNGKDAPPLTIEERFKGSNIMEGTIEESVAKRSVNDSFAADAQSNPAAYKAKIKASGNKQADAVSKLLDELQNSPGDNDNSAVKDAYKAKKTKFINLITQSGIAEINTPSPNHIMERHAVMKFLMNRYSARIISVQGPFNPFIMCGFPAAVLADENRGAYKTTRSIIGQVVSIRHQIHTSGSANTQVVLNCCRFLSEPTDMDEWGNPLFVGDTDRVQAEIDTTSYFYKDKDKKNYSPLQNGYPRNRPEDVSGSSYIFDWQPNPVDFDPKDDKKRQLKWAKDILTISKEGRAEGKDNMNFTDFKYTPTQIGVFYDEILGMSRFKHFMLGHEKKPNGESLTFVFDSIHEALDNLTQSASNMNNYLDAIRFVKRDVVTEDDYFVKILGASFRAFPIGSDDKKDIMFTNRSAFLERRVQNDNLWYGLPSTDSDSAVKINPWYYDKERKKYIPEGGFSSIYEKAPVTPFLRERRSSAQAYIQEVNQRVNSTR